MPQTGGPRPRPSAAAPPAVSAAPQKRRTASSRVVLRGPSPPGVGGKPYRPVRTIRMTIVAAAAGALVLFAVTYLVIHSILGRASMDPGEIDDGLAGLFEGEEGVGGFHKRRKKGGPRRDGDGTDLDALYPSIRAEHDAAFPPGDVARLIEFASSLREREYVPFDPDLPYDVNNCPSTPPEGYPASWPVLDVIGHWNPDDAEPHLKIHQGLCRFDAGTEFDKALNYRRAEVPFVIRDDPTILPTVERWNQPEYLTKVLGRTKKHRTDYAETNHLMFYRTKHLPQVPSEWKEPTTEVDLSYPEWLERANNPNVEELGPDKPHWYFRLNGKSPDGTGFLFEELPFFKPKENFYMVDPTDARGINCRFGMRGNTAENHYDASRNFIALFGGERRYLLSHPDQCRKLALYPMGHPSARHSAVNWAEPDLDAYPQFADASVNEVVLQAGDVLYLPTNWFHHIVSLDTNFQCNARSGVTSHYHHHIQECGFKISSRGLY